LLFIADYCPVRIVGKYDTAPFVMFALNPGGTMIRKAEDEEARKSWEHYLRLYANWFKFPQYWIKSPYYVALGHLLRGLTNNDSMQPTELFDSYFCNVELIPFHSSLPSNLSKPQLDYLMDSFTNSLEFILESKKAKLFLFNGSIWNVLLIKQGRIKVDKKVQISKDFNLYFFKIAGVSSVLFDKFFQVHYYGMTHYDRRVKIPTIIHENVTNLLSVDS
jgi:hypothetical protein